MTYRQTDNSDIDRPAINKGDGSLAEVTHHPLTPLKLNPDDYKDELTDFDLSEEQQNELLQILWDITANFALMGFGMDATQTVMNTIFKDVAQDSSNAVKQIDSTVLDKQETQDD